MAAEQMLDFSKFYDPIFGMVLGGLRALAARLVEPQAGMRILDIGCGTGEQLAVLQQAGGEVYGIDLSEAILKIAGEKLGGAAALSIADAIEIPFPDGAFDLVIFSLFLHQLDPGGRSAAVNEAMRAARPGGRVLVVDFHAGPIETIRGNLTKLVISAVEFLAGWQHFSNSRDFLARGGLPQLALDLNFSVLKEIIVWDGNLAVYLLDRAGGSNPP